MKDIALIELLKVLLTKDPSKRLLSVIDPKTKEVSIQNDRWFTPLEDMDQGVT